MSERTRGRGLWAALVGLALAQAARAEEPWAGVWAVEGTTARRYVFAAGEGVGLEERLGEAGWEVRVRGADRPRLVLTGAAQVDGIDGPATLEAVRDRDDPGAALVVVRAAGREVRERWVRLGRPRLGFRVVGGAEAGPEGGLRLTPRAGPLALEVVVGGRPQAVVVRVLAADGEYAALDGLVHHASIADGAALPLGAHPAAWDGRDRGWDPRPVRPGRYTLVVTPSDDGVGAAPDGGPAAGVAIVVPLLVEADEADGPVEADARVEAGDAAPAQITQAAAPGRADEDVPPRPAAAGSGSGSPPPPSAGDRPAAVPALERAPRGLRAGLPGR